MIKVTRTIKLKFVDLNRCKAQMFELMTEENTRIANQLLSFLIKERRKMTTTKIMSELKSALVNQVIRHTKSPTGRQTKQYKVLPVEVNNQNWKLTLKGNTYSISFPTLKGEKRIPIKVASPHWQPVLDGLLEGTIQGGSFKLIKHRNKWYAYLSITEDVPERDASVMDSFGLNYGVLGTPPNSVNTGKQEYIQLSLFDWCCDTRIPP